MRDAPVSRFRGPRLVHWAEWLLAVARPHAPTSSLCPPRTLGLRRHHVHPSQSSRHLAARRRDADPGGRHKRRWYRGASPSIRAEPLPRRFGPALPGVDASTYRIATIRSSPDRSRVWVRVSAATPQSSADDVLFAGDGTSWREVERSSGFGVEISPHATMAWIATACDTMTSEPSSLAKWSPSTGTSPSRRRRARAGSSEARRLRSGRFLRRAHAKRHRACRAHSRRIPARRAHLPAVTGFGPHLWQRARHVSNEPHHRDQRPDPRLARSQRRADRRCRVCRPIGSPVLDRLPEIDGNTLSVLYDRAVHPLSPCRRGPMSTPWTAWRPMRSSSCRRP